MFLLAQIGGYSIVHLLIMAIVIAGVIAIAYVGFRKLGVQPPDWIVQIFWIVVVVVVCIFAIKLIMGMA